MSSHPFAVLGEPAALAEAVRWYAEASGGRATLEPEVLPEREPPDGWAAYSEAGGLGRPPGNSQFLADSLLSTIDRPAPAAAAGGVLVVVPPGAGFVPHAWRFRGGGYWLGGRTWVRRYALVPSDAPLGTVAHELGHLVFGWSDHDARSGVGPDCLMGTGAGASPPARPCAPSRVDAGWVEPVPPARSMVVGDLADGRVVRSRGRLIELGPSGDLLVFVEAAVTARLRAEPTRPLLAAAAPALRPARGLPPHLSRV